MDIRTIQERMYHGYDHSLNESVGDVCLLKEGKDLTLLYFRVQQVIRKEASEGNQPLDKYEWEKI